MLQSPDNISESADLMFKQNSASKPLVVTGYLLIFLLGITGNVLVVIIVAKSSQMRTITNIFICNLALSDILMCSIAVPFTPLAVFMKDWSLPSALCKLLPMTMGVSVYVSTLTSTAIAADRFFIIVHPFLPRMKTSLCAFIIAVIWIIAILISLPLAVYQKKYRDQTIQASKCQEIWPKESSREVFTIVSFILQFVLPCSVICVCYYRISKILKQRCKTKIGSGTKSSRSRETEVRRKRKTNKMLIAMVTIFVICWIPLNMLWMATDLLLNVANIEIRKYNSFPVIFFACHMIAMSSAVYNPFLYAWLNENFKREFRTLVPFLACILKTSHSNNASITCRRDSRLATTYQMTTCEQEEDPANTANSNNAKKSLIPTDKNSNFVEGSHRESRKGLLKQNV